MLKKIYFNHKSICFFIFYSFFSVVLPVYYEKETGGRYAVFRI